MNAIWVFLGGGLGSVCRYGLSLLTKKINFASIAWGTLVSNVLASVILIIAVLLLKEKGNTNTIQLFLITGFCGGFSTFSTFSYESIILFQSGNYVAGFANVILNIAICFIAILLFLR